MDGLKPFALLSVVMAAGLIAVGVIAFSIGIYDIAERDIQAYHDASGGLDVSIENEDGDITVLSWSDPQNRTVQVTAHLWTIYGPEALDGVSVKFIEGAELKIEPQVSDKRNWVEVDLTVYIPIGVNVTKVYTSSGAVRMEDCNGSAEIDTDNGPVTVLRHAGDLDIENDNGRIYVKDQEGNVTAGTSNGPIRMTNINGTVSAATSNGNIELDNVAVLRKAVTDNGVVEVHILNISANGADVRSSNADIRVYIPADLQARLYLRTDNGHASIHNMPVLYERDEGDYKIGNVNGGGPKLEAVTDNGNIDVWGEVS